MAKHKRKVDKVKLREQTDVFLGPEPSFPSDHQLNRLEYLGSLNWYATVLSKEDSKDYVVKFLRQQKRLDDIKKLNKVSPGFITTTYGGIARMLMNNVRIPETGAAWLNKNLQMLFEKHMMEEPKEEKKTVAPPVNIQTRIDAKVRSIAGEIDDLFEDNVWFDTVQLEPDAIYKFLHSKQVSGMVAEKVAALFEPHLEELKSIGDDPQLKEAYKKYSKTDIKRFIGFYQSVVDTCKNFNVNVKKMKVRKPKMKKAVPADKKVATLKYLKLFNEYQLASVNPAKVIGAEQVYLYSTKYRALTVLNALDRGGINIKGQTFVNFDEKTSFRKDLPQKRAEEIVKAISVAGKRAANNIWNDVQKATRDPKARSSEDTIVLAVY
jgi:hypothetical protein